ncbi:MULTISPECIES: LysR family transcriptional regulator [Dyella]|uniref:LysR family transcriptional regulator n=2 Tax=Dyella TaxID=231454 RepID=A0A4R0YUF0_9GAMM|nr:MULTISPECIES: LysR family transcriptional regulator [Dyella]TBR39502.1 LysR family transcriptional regulator [Dyella terrae]TCI12912.1 LysR family transcriptional regulator [Dyella soli]
MLSEDELALLEAIRDSGSLSRAAARLGKAPSTVSHAARQLEARFDALLFDRRRYRLQLTPAGQLLAQEAARLSLDVSRLTQRVKQVASGWEDRLWVVTDELLEFELLIPVIQAFDALRSGVSLRITHEVLGGTWESLRDGRADLVVGATNEPPSMPHLKWFELGVIDWVFAVSPRHPLAKVREPLTRDMIAAHRSVVVADSSRSTSGRVYGVQSGQPVLAVPSMQAKVRAQQEGLGVGWVPRDRAAGLIKTGALVQKKVANPREPNVLYVGWRGDQEGRALAWWLEQLRQPRLARRLLQGREITA